MTTNEILVLDCGHSPSDHLPITSGYGVDPETGKKYCYACCADRDRKQMDEDGRTYLYLAYESPPRRWGEKPRMVNPRVTNWPGSLSYKVHDWRVGKHNIARWRYDVWFRDYKGELWWGVQYGDNTQVCHCKRLKSGGAK